MNKALKTLTFIGLTFLIVTINIAKAGRTGIPGTKVDYVYKDRMSSDDEFSESDYLSIAKIINSLSYDEQKDLKLFAKLPVDEQIIWETFIDRFTRYNPNKKENYFAKICYNRDDRNDYYAKHVEKLFSKNYRRFSPIIIEWMLKFYPKVGNNSKLTKENVHFLARLLRNYSGKRIEFAINLKLFMFSDYYGAHKNNISKEDATKILHDLTCSDYLNIDHEEKNQGTVIKYIFRKRMTFNDEFSQSEYKIIAKILGDLTFKKKEDKKYLAQLPKEKQLIWEAFRDRFNDHNPDKENNEIAEIYYRKINTQDYFSPTVYDLLVKQNKRYSPIVIELMVIFYPLSDKTVQYTKEDVKILSKLLLECSPKSRTLRGQILCSLLVGSNYFENDGKTILEKLTPNERFMIKRFFQRKAEQKTKKGDDND